MACYTQEEIAAKEGVGRKTVDDVVAKIADVQKPLKPSAILTTCEVQIYTC
jgi:hypothetical protein